MLCAASGKGIHRPLKSTRDEPAGHQYRAQVSLDLYLIDSPLQQTTAEPDDCLEDKNEDLPELFFAVLRS